MIVAEGLSKSFGRVKALDGLSVKVPRGINGLVGPNGAGKTTLIHVLVGLLKPDSGSVEVMGLEPWSQRRELMKRVGVLLERPVFPQGVSGMRYMLHVARVRGLPDREAVEALRRVGLLKHADRKISEYSAGMKVRLGLAKATLGRPELVILDEPTANLDPRGRIEFLKLVRAMHREEGTSFLISSHVLPELQKVCSWVCLMSEGRVVEQGYVSELLDKYASGVYLVRVSNPGGLAEALRRRGFKAKLAGDALYVAGSTPELRREVLRLALEAGGDVLEFRPLRRSLENVYVKAVEGGGRG